MDWIRSWLREPLLHFLLIGTGLFVVSGFLGEPTPSDTRVVVTPGHVERLVEAWRRTWQRPPTAQELEGLIEDHIKEEILYREAIAMGLDRNDTIIRRRLRQKMEFLAEDIAAQDEPAEEELELFLEQNADRFRIDATVSFTHVYLNRDRRGERTLAGAEALLARLRQSGEALDTDVLGDRLPLPQAYESASETEIARLFGQPFAEQLLELTEHQWSGPIESAYGLHLVFLRERVEARAPELAEVRDEVAREWRARRREETNSELYQLLREKYQVIVELPE